MFFFFEKSNLALFVPCGEPSVLFLGSLLLIVDFESAWRVFFTSCLDVAKGFFLTMERILWSSTTVVFCGHPGLFVLLSSPFSFCFSECTKLVIWQLLMFLLSLWCFFFFFFFLSLILKPCLFLLQGDLLWPQYVGSEANSFQMQMAHLESTPKLWPA